MLLPPDNYAAHSMTQVYPGADQVEHFAHLYVVFLVEIEMAVLL